MPPLKKAIEVTFYKSVTCRYEGEDVKMPTLEDVFQEFPSTPINVDLKGKEEVLMKKVKNLTILLNNYLNELSFYEFVCNQKHLKSLYK